MPHGLGCLDGVMQPPRNQRQRPEARAHRDLLRGADLRGELHHDLLLLGARRHVDGNSELGLGLRPGEAVAVAAPRRRRHHDRLRAPLWRRRARRLGLGLLWRPAALHEKEVRQVEPLRLLELVLEGEGLALRCSEELTQSRVDRRQRLLQLERVLFWVVARQLCVLEQPIQEDIVEAVRGGGGEGGGKSGA